MITIFCNPRPFKDPFIQLQMNTLASWKALKPAPQIILIEDEEGTTKPIANKLGITCLETVKKNQFGSLLLDDVFKKVIKQAKYPIIAQVNIDILLFQDFFEAIKAIQLSSYFMVGRRWDLDLNHKIDLNNVNWQDEVQQLAKKQGKYHAITGSDYWVFPKEVNFEVPQFVVGRPAADNWLIYKARELDIPVIDASSDVMIIHQNHPRLDGTQNYEIEKMFNQELYRKTTGNIYQEGIVFDLQDATHNLENGSIHCKPRGLSTVLRQLLYARYSPNVLHKDKKLWKNLAIFLAPMFAVLLWVRKLFFLRQT